MSSTKSRSSFMGGFNKRDVGNYIEKIYREYELKIKEKDEELDRLKSQLKDMRIKYEQLQNNFDRASDDRSKIADVLIKAQEKADNIIDEAKNLAMEEKDRISKLVEMEKDKLIKVKSELKNLKEMIHGKLREYELQLDDILGEESIEIIIESNSELFDKL